MPRPGGSAGLPARFDGSTGMKKFEKTFNGKLLLVNQARRYMFFSPDTRFTVSNSVALLGWPPRRAVLLTWLGALPYAGLVAGLFGLALGGVTL